MTVRSSGTFTSQDARFLDLAIRLGARGNGRTWPNPSVGCVIVRDGRILARAATAPGGRPHAETQALAQAGAQARGATVYVSLEPCAHVGETPSCASALVAAGVGRVVAAMEDPDPRTAGQGSARLKAAGIDVLSDAAPEAARTAHRGFCCRILQKRPYVTLKLAASLDGRIATATGESRWITGPEARRLVHGMRLRSDAVMVGAGTARADDPELSVRAFGAVAQPVRIIVSRHLDLPEEGRLAASARTSPLWLCHGADAPATRIDAWSERGARSLPVPIGSGRQVDLAGLLERLGQEGLGTVLCEGGGAFAASLLAADLVDELVTFSAGLALGAEGHPSLGAMGIDALAAAPRFDLEALARIGRDTMATWRPRRTA